MFVTRFLGYRGSPAPCYRNHLSNLPRRVASLHNRRPLSTSRRSSNIIPRVIAPSAFLPTVRVFCYTSSPKLFINFSLFDSLNDGCHKTYQAAKMNFVVLFAVFTSLLVVLVHGGSLAPSFGSGDITKQLKNKDYIMKQINCVLGKGACDGVGKQLKVAIPEVITKNCKGCSSQQAANAKRLVTFMQTKYPAEWSKIVAKFKH